VGIWPSSSWFQPCFLAVGAAAPPAAGRCAIHFSSSGLGVGNPWPHQHLAPTGCSPGIRDKRSAPRRFEPAVGPARLQQLLPAVLLCCRSSAICVRRWRACRGGAGEQPDRVAAHRLDQLPPQSPEAKGFEAGGVEGMESESTLTEQLMGLKPQSPELGHLSARWRELGLHRA